MCHSGPSKKLVVSLMYTQSVAVTRPGAGSIHSVLYLFPLWVGTYLGIMDNMGKTQNVQTEKVRNTRTIKVF